MCTYRSIQRANERTCCNGKAAVRFVEKGIERGKTSEDFNQDERESVGSSIRFFCLLGIVLCLRPDRSRKTML